MRHGLRLTHIHRVISDNQSNWLKQYIDNNTQCRVNGDNVFEKDVYILINIVMYGKTIENIRNRLNIGFYTSGEKIIKKSSKGNARTTILTDKQAAITFNKPIYIGAEILNLSKYSMYHFHCEYMKPKVPLRKYVIWLQIHLFIIFKL